MWPKVLPTILAGVLIAGTFGACSSDDESEAGDGRQARSPAKAETADGSNRNGARKTQPGSNGEGSDAKSGSAAPPPAPPTGDDSAVGYALETNNACLQARQQGAASGTSLRKPAELRRYAREALPRAGLTLNALRKRQPPGPSRGAAQALQAEYTQLLGLYQQAATAKGASAEALLSAVKSAERTARSKAAAAGLRACAPGPPS